MMAHGVKTLRLLAALLIPSVTFSGCSTLDVVNAISPAKGVSVARGMAYGPLPRQKLDIYRPAAATENSAVLIFFYGGAWEGGERENYAFVASKLATLGYFVVVPDYRVYPQVRFPAFVEDGALASAWVVEHMEEQFGRRRPLFLMGHSAGAHIAMLLAVDDRYLKRQGHDQAELAGVIALAGPFDFLPLESARLREIFDTPEKRRSSQPINFVDPSDPPTLLLHGDQDRRVWLRNSLNMAESLGNSGVRVRLVVYPGVGHAAMLKPFVGLIGDDAGMLREILSFTAHAR